LFGQRSGTLKIAILSVGQNRAERLHVSLKIAGHAPKSNGFLAAL
jgi:hypothetical protein